MGPILSLVVGIWDYCPYSGSLCKKTVDFKMCSYSRWQKTIFRRTGEGHVIRQDCLELRNFLTVREQRIITGDSCYLRVKWVGRVAANVCQSLLGDFLPSNPLPLRDTLIVSETQRERERERE